jgi:alpha-tubulin suppressor-like RCC1 family protein
LNFAIFYFFAMLIRTISVLMFSTNFISSEQIAAGGWHSAAISEFSDLYMFGWNESGQLALPTNLAREATKSYSTLLVINYGIHYLPYLKYHREILK